MKLIVGLGNPGDKYQKTRHNIGFVMIGQFIDSNQIGKFSYDNKYGGEVLVSQTPFNSTFLPHPNPSPNRRGVNGVIFLKPMEYMNKSGAVVQKIMNFYKIEAKDLLVIHDDIDLATGVVKLKEGGGLAGHNGLKDIAEKIGTKDFSRIRIGVDRPSHPSQDVADYVLGNFKKDEIEHIQDKYLDIDRMVLEFVNK